MNTKSALFYMQKSQ